ncbi:hypothetical protein MT418_001130 [Batrachochytrium dendrobatidis]
MKYSLQISGTHSGDCSPSVIVRFDSGRYLFNCGEGTQRLCNEHKIRLSKLRGIFMTRTKWDCIGGLPGMILTVADAGLDSFRLYGPRNLSYFLAGTRKFMFRPNINISVVDIESSKFDYSDENIHIKAIALTPELGDSSICPISPLAGRKRSSHESNRESKDDAYFLQKIIKQMFPKQPEGLCRITMQKQVQDIWDDFKSRGYNWDQLPSTADDAVSLCYICQGPEIAGTLDPVLAMKLGVKRGPDMGKLKSGQTVLSINGVPISPDQCVTPRRPGPVFLILDCPSKSYIASLIENAIIKQAASGEKPAQCVVHICGDKVLTDQRYIDFMNSFPSTTQHIYISEKHNKQTLIFESYTRIQNQLHMLDSSMFLLPYVAPPLKDLPVVFGLPKSAKPAELLLSYQFEPKLLIDVSECRSELVMETGTNAYKEYVCLAKQTVDAINAAEKERSDAMAVSRKDLSLLSVLDPTEGVAVTPLGTGSAIPGKYRNVSSTLIQTPQNAYLLDAGEGTYGQLFRHFGPIELQRVFESLSFMCVSHMHADHHLGTITVLLEWAKATEKTSKRLLLVAPTQMWNWLCEYTLVQKLPLDRIEFVDAATTKWKREDGANQSYATNNSVFLKAGLSKMTTVGVNHCPEAYAIVAETISGFKFGFSGDCRPSHDFAIAGKGAHFLLHEATFDDEKQQEAIDRRHCTINEAIQVGQEMQAKCLLLTHFSQRYPKLPNIDSPTNESVGTATGPIVGAAFDLMRIPIQYFWKFPKMLPALKLLFPPEE